MDWDRHRNDRPNVAHAKGAKKKSFKLYHEKQRRKKKKQYYYKELEHFEKQRIVQTIKKSQFAPYLNGLMKGKNIVQLRDLMVYLGLPHTILS